MCGIAGFIGRKKINESAIYDTLKLMNFRGPNGQAYVKKEQKNIVYLLHTRLSIIDLDSRSNQPFVIGDYTIIFNGEIYNYLELKKLLHSKGVSFSTTSDTEVLLQMFIHFGEKCISMLEGMWSFAIYNDKSQQLFLSRDRFGEKPLYYYETNDGIYFASQTSFIKTLSKDKMEINQNQLNRLLVNGSSSLFKTDETYYKACFELSFGQNMTINSDLKINKSSYFTPSYHPTKMSIEDAVSGIRERLIESMKLRLRSDVPMAFCLSGGIDSSSIVSIAAKEFNQEVTTFSIIDPDKRYNELDNIDATINDLGCNSVKIDLEPKNMLSRLEDLVEYHDAPLASISFLVHSLLMEQIKNRGFKIAFSGTASDELFTGYYEHFNYYLNEQKNKSNYAPSFESWNEHILPLIRNPYLRDPEFIASNPWSKEYIYLNHDVFTSYMKNNFSEEYVYATYTTDCTLRNKMLNQLFHEGSRLLLGQEDLNSMRYSIESRAPYLDSKLYEFAYSIPTEFLIQKGFGKYLLRESMKGILNDKVRLDREKKGFNASINSIIDFSNQKDREFILENSPIYDLIDRKSIENVINQKEMPNSFSKFIFNFINAKIFLEKNQ